MELLNGGVVKAGTPVQDIKFIAANMQRKCARGKTAKTLLVQSVFKFLKLLDERSFDFQLRPT